MNAAARNARRLASDARILFEAERYPSAASIAILAIEESGKLALLREIATAPDDTTLRDAWKRYRDHRAKNVAWIIVDLAKRGAASLSDLTEIFDPQSDHPEILDQVKQLGFYTDCYADRHWSEPIKIVDDHLARSLVYTAEILLPRAETTEREMQLWTQLVGPHWGTPEMLHGAVRFHAAMRKEGLTTRTPEEIERFFFGLAKPGKGRSDGRD